MNPMFFWSAARAGVVAGIAAVSGAALAENYVGVIYAPPPGFEGLEVTGAGDNGVMAGTFMNNSQAVKAGGMVFCSGQIPIDPATGEFVAGGDADQTDQVLRNLSEVLLSAGASLKSVVKTSVFLADMNDFAEMNEVYARYFSENKPARATVQAAGLPRGARVEIDCIALLEAK